MLLGFTAQFADLVESGKKTQTIRAPRRDGRVPKHGERVYLYTGLRTPKARKLGEGVVSAVKRIDITRHGNARPTLEIDGVWIGMRWDPFRAEREFAQRDGFKDAAEMYAWFEKVHGLPFHGHLIRWRLLPRSEWKKPARG